MNQSIIILGPAHPLRGGGMTTFNERLAKQFQQEGDGVTIYSFSLQYPSFLFPGKTQYTDEPAPENINIKSVVNSINPFNWLRIGNQLKKLKPDIIVVRYWLPFMGPCLGTILRLVKKNKHTKVICIADNVSPHEKRFGDKMFTRYFMHPVDAFITLSENVMNDLRAFTQKPAVQTVHPLYDNFGEPISKAAARQYLGLPLQSPIILFFGFIRKYKGLDLLLHAMQLMLEKNSGAAFRVPTLIVAGEFYDDKKIYQEQISKLSVAAKIIVHDSFIPNTEVKYFLCAADFVIQPYRDATQSGVTPLAYHFEKPMLVTNVGGLPQMVPHEKAGLVCEPNAASIARGIERLYELGENYFLPQLREEKKKYSWQVLTDIIRGLAN
ncbi:MAG TPA: glycosyltransferase [Chitinophagaceae bacterium]|nr:glycosyltransferase [Chitinophagaceae bacterium]